MKLKPNTLVVVEGPDGTGKTSLLKALQPWFPQDLFTHQPSGESPLSKAIYKLTESEAKLDPLARQFLHLASHAQHYPEVIAKKLKTRGVFMDRCWISTIVYGYYGSTENQRHFKLEDFWRVAQMPARGIRPTVVVYCSAPYKRDARNLGGVITGYEKIMRNLHPLRVPSRRSPEELAEWLIGELYGKGLIVERSQRVPLPG